ncbi:hypothetical protein BJ165DRAFT_1534821 [Panaeolus papilionaceus]|nr:hypothetical protein BJ165DRAFT_1534821 [Panaeolus papilionaceus]
MSNSKLEPLKESTARVAIIGAGAGGLACSIYLKQKLGFTNFVVYEKASGVGGTWRDNIYPGCASDVALPFYSLSTDLRDWKSSHGSNVELNDYWEELAAKYHLYSHISFNTKVISAKWDEQAQRYDIALANIETGERTSAKAEIVISAIGILENPRYADIPGVGDFNGELFHSARWDKSVELRDKRVGVVGNGASATQFVPIITRDEEVNVVHFCRTPNWFFPDASIISRGAHCYLTSSSVYRWLRRNIPITVSIERMAHFLKHEMLYWTIFSNAFTRNVFQKGATKYILNKAPAQYKDKLIPDFGVGCKRIVVDTDYLVALHRPNLTMNWDGIERIVENGILTKKGEVVPLDVLIFATGYSADKYQLPVVGSKGMSIQEYYDSQKGPKAYLGTTIPGFPNFFTIFGPNTATGHTSVIYTNEVQINYILQLIKPVLQRRVLSIEVTEKAADEYDDKVQKRLSKSVFTQCLSWYRVGQTGKVTNAFPGSSTMFWLWLRKPDWTHYHTTNTSTHAQKWLKKLQRKQKVVSALAKTAIVFQIFFLAAWWKYPGLPGMKLRPQHT